MKNIIIGLIVITVFSCNQSGTKKSKMEQAKIIEMVLWKSKEGISKEDAKKAITKLNDFVKEQPGFIARNTAISDDGRFLDIVYWTDITSAKIASKKAMESEICKLAFSTIDEKEMTFLHFEMFNSFE